MKIRKGFVSNSSSSSFLIGYNSLKDLERFSAFEGTEALLQDMNKCSDEMLIDFFIGCIKLSEVFLGFDCNNRKNGFQPGHFKNSPVMDLYKAELISEDEFDSICDVSAGKFTKDFKVIAEMLLKNFKKRFSDHALVEYGNEIDSDFDFGYYMEFSFMKFLGADPEHKICVIRKSNH